VPQQLEERKAIAGRPMTEVRTLAQTSGPPRVMRRSDDPGSTEVDAVTVFERRVVHIGWMHRQARRVAERHGAVACDRPSGRLDRRLTPRVVVEKWFVCRRVVKVGRCWI
jgi:hypothetical protein